MWQIINSAKVAQCDETGKVALLINGNAFTIGAGGAAGEATQSDWSVNDEADPAFIKNRTHYEDVVLGDTLTWDGTPTDVFVETSPGFFYYKVSDAVLTQSDISEGFVVGISSSQVVQISAEQAAQFAFDETGSAMLPYCAVVGEDGAAIQSVAFPQKGIYFVSANGDYANYLKVPGMTAFGTRTVKPLDDKYIPDTIQRKLTGAEGQVVGFDAEGNACAQEAPAGGSITLSSIAVTKAPTTTLYKPGDVFDPEGMVVTATYSNGVKRVLPECDYTIAPTGAFTNSSDGILTIEYIEGGVVASVEYAVSVFVIKDNFADNSWETIVTACKQGLVPDTWVVGNSKPMTINGKDYQIDIIGRNHDIYANSVTDSVGKQGDTAPLTLQMHDCYETLYSTASEGPPGAGVDGYNSTYDGYSSVYNVTGKVTNAMPSDIRSKIRSVIKKASRGYDPSVGGQHTLFTGNPTDFLLTTVEVYGETKGALDGEGTQYAYYAAGNSKVKLCNGTATDWWLVSPVPNSTSNRYYVDAQGEVRNGNVSNKKGISVAFCF